MPSISRRGLLAAGAGLVAAGAAAAVDPDTVRPPQRLDPTVPDGTWPGRKRDPSRTGHAPESGPRESPQLQPLFDPPRDPQAPPGVVASEDAVFLVGPGRTLAIDAATGDRDWERAHRERDPVGTDRTEFVQGGPVVAGDRVLTVADTTLYALRRETGALDWSFGTNSSFASLLVVGNTVFLGSLLGPGDRLLALSIDTGLRYWQRATDAVPVAHAPVPGYLLVSAGDDRGAIQARNPRTGGMEWETVRPGLPAASGFATPAVADGRVYAVGDAVYALDTATGDEAWRAPVAVDGRGPVTDGERVYVTGDAVVTALDATTGDEVWTEDVAAAGRSALAAAGDRLYVPVADGVLALATGDGRPAFGWHEPGEPPTGMAAAGERLYVRTESNAYALEDRS
jgi:outer membrane protein assembly factor BamB